MLVWGYFSRGNDTIPSALATVDINSLTMLSYTEYSADSF
jgi:hypothetical protein